MPSRASAHRRVAVRVVPDGLDACGADPLGAVTGWWLGYQAWSTVVAGIFAAFVSAAIGVSILIMFGRMARSSHIALGPFLLIGTTIALIV